MSVRGVHLPEEEALWRRDIERRLRALETAGRLTNASIGSGGLVMKDGGSIIIEGGDGVELSSSGLEVNGGRVVAVSIDSDTESRTGLPTGLSESFTSYLDKEFTPPSWATRVQVVAIVEARAQLNSDDGTSLIVKIEVEGTQEAFSQVRLPGPSGGIKEGQITTVAFKTLTSWTDPIKVEGFARKSEFGSTTSLMSFDLSTLFIATVG